MPWFRMYTDFLNDPKMISLAFEDQRHFIGVLALKGEGTLDNDCAPELLTRIVAQRLWIDHSVVGEVKRRLVAAGLIDENWQPLAWEKRQMRSDSSTERVRAHREKAKQTRNDDETLQERSSNALDKKREEEIREEESETKPARRAPRVALHSQIRSLELPGGIPADVWAMWCEHREAKTKEAPWTLAAAKVSIKRMAKLASEGQAADVTVEEAVLRGWTGLFPVKQQGASSSGGAVVPADWWKSEAGYLELGKQLGVDRAKFQFFEQYKARVCKLAGPGEWMEDLLRAVGRESEERYEALYAYFNDIPRDKNGNTEAA
ncbi:gp60 [Caballeronia cordobensis]|uniref:Gp60 n=2 Tax=Caballeronia cordobensis TaxID=1353886 RepID=A0A158FKC8_CABCO|nr:gp60 [Caballeronia cordobensis]